MWRSSSVGVPRVFSSLPLPLLLLGSQFLLGILLVGAQDGECDLPCPTDRGATCAFGNAPLNDDLPGGSSSSNIDGMHCANCPAFTTGLQCELPYASCGDGQHVCYHGGTCQEGEVDDYGNWQLYCDCSATASTSANGRPYVGKYCQHETVDEAEVGACDDTNVDVYCRNGGICNGNYPEFGDPCLCSGGHTGPRCEYTNGDNSTTVSGNGGCSLSCQNGGTCTVGQQDLADEYRFWEDDPSDTEYCNCPDSWDGPYCEIPRVPCGTNHCFYGSQCVSETVDGETLHHCDCLAAATETTAYAGRFCQYEAIEFCSPESGPNGHLFCVHGSCRDPAYEGCNCPPGYTGFSCEFRTSFGDVVVDQEIEGRPVLDSEANADCSMDCQNGGTCRHGTKQIGGGLDLFAGDTEHLNEEAGTQNFQHCVCPDDFAGTYCEHAVEACDADGQFLCMHGGACVDNEQLCDCSQADSELATFFAGNHCEHPVTDICLDNVPPGGQPSGSTSANLGEIMPGAALYFCLNSGTCKAYVDSSERGHPGCHCQEGYLGPHCELREAAQVPGLHNKNPYDKNFTGRFKTASGPSTFQKTVLSLSVLALAAIAVFAIAMYRRRKRKRSNAITSSLNWQQPNYRDRPADEVNIAPRRSSSLYSSSPDVYEEAVQERVVGRSSRRDPMAAHLAAAAAARSVQDYPDDDDDDERLDDSGFSDHAPQVDMGPPLDDDGHELHNVSIV